MSSFKGSRLALLKDRYPAYIASENDKQPFWRSLFRDWWMKFPWRLPDDQEPPNDATSLTLLRVEPTNDETHIKAHIESELEMKVMRWYLYQKAISESYVDFPPQRPRARVSWSELAHLIEEFCTSYDSSAPPRSPEGGVSEDGDRVSNSARVDMIAILNPLIRVIGDLTETRVGIFAGAPARGDTEPFIRCLHSGNAFREHWPGFDAQFAQMRQIFVESLASSKVDVGSSVCDDTDSYALPTPATTITTVVTSNVTSTPPLHSNPLPSNQEGLSVAPKPLNLYLSALGEYQEDEEEVDQLLEEDIDDEPSLSRSRVSAGKPSDAIDPTCLPEWMANHYIQYLKVVDDDQFQQVVNLWANLEIAYERLSQEHKGLSSTNQRPVAIRMWIRTSRPKSVPKLGDLTVFKHQFWTWWIGLQPLWRKEGMARVTKGSWDSLMKPGPNGLLTVVASLSWWKRMDKDDDNDAKDDDACPRWENVVADVKWAMAELLEAVLSLPPETQNPSGSSQPPAPSPSVSPLTPLSKRKTLAVEVRSQKKAKLT